MILRDMRSHVWIKGNTRVSLVSAES